MTRKKVAVLCGGRSAEHRISLISAQNILRALAKTSFEPILIGIDLSGEWRSYSADEFLAQEPHAKRISLPSKGQSLLLSPGSKEPILYKDKRVPFPKIEALFPITHGPYGEDGSLQGLLRHLNLPFVGPDVLGSAICMDKVVSKQLLTQVGIPNARFRVVHSHEIDRLETKSILSALGLPLFVKPSNMGSSVGITKVSLEEELLPAIKHALHYDQKVLIEEFVDGREIECAVLGNANPKASEIGEIIPENAFYSFEAKYVSDTGAKLEIPAPNLSTEKKLEVQSLACKTYVALCCEGLSRVDFFMKNNGQIYVNEVNTLPGFTSISMYPKLWEVSGLPYEQLIEQLIELAMERYQKQQALAVL